MLIKSALGDEIADLVSAIELGYWQSNQIQHEKCRVLFELCKKNKHKLLGYAYLLYGRSFMIIGDLAAAQKKLTSGVRKCKNDDDFKHLATGQLWLGIVESKLANKLVAFNCWRSALVAAIEMSNLTLALEIFINICHLYYDAGWKDEAFAMLNNCFSMAEVIEDRKLLAKAGIFLSDYLIEKSEYQAAMAVIIQTELDVILHSDVTWIVQICKNKAECLWRTGNNAAAFECYEAGRILAKQFDMTWALIEISLSYAGFLLESQATSEAIQIVDEVEQCLPNFPDVRLKIAWLKLKYQCCRKDGDIDLAYFYLKEHQKYSHDAQIGDSESNLGFELSGLLIRKYGQLQGVFRKCERMADLYGIRVTTQKLRQFVAKCELGLNQDRIIELTIETENIRQVWQRVAQMINSYCSIRELWIGFSSGRFFIYPAAGANAFFDFSKGLSSAIEVIPWARMDIKAVTVKSRILMVNEEIINQVSQVIERGWRNDRSVQ